MMGNIGRCFYSLTPKPKMKEGSLLYFASRRCDEIRQWLDLNPSRTRFVVLDDNVWPTDFPDANQVHTDGWAGALTEAKADELIGKLLRQGGQA